MTSVWMAAGLIVIAGLHSVGTVGVTGGPNHGEHPFIVSIVHMAAFFSWEKTGLRVPSICIGAA